MKAGFLSVTRRYFVDWARRLWRSRGWAAAQLGGVALLAVAVMGWTRIPEKHAWQVMLTLLIPLLLVVGFLLLQAATLRSFLRPLAMERDSDPARVSLIWGAATLLVWLVIAGLVWRLLDHFDDQIELWASYLNSRFGAGWRAHIFSEPRLSWFFHHAEFVLRWLVLPGLLLPLCSSAAWGLRRLPWPGLNRVWINWRWWLGLLAASLISVVWPATFFTANPHGTVAAQIGRVAFKLALAYLLAIFGWLAVQSWAATLLLFDGGVSTAPEEYPGELAGAGVRVIPPGGGKSGSVRLPLPEGSDNSVGNS